jgi:hypothetical protein
MTQWPDHSMTQFQWLDGSIEFRGVVDLRFLVGHGKIRRTVFS